MSNLLKLIEAYEVANWTSQLAWLIAALPSLIVAATPLPKVSAALKVVSKILNFFSLLTHKDSPGTLKLPFTQSRPPLNVSVSIGATVSALFLGLFLAGSAQAQTFSAGLSVPILEFNKKGSPVVFAPGTGLEGSVGLFPMDIAGMESDMLVISVAGFATAPGALQVAMTAGTLGNLICAGAAVPLVAADGSGAFQGSFNVFPVLGGNITFSLYSAPENSAAALAVSQPKKKKLGTVYLGFLSGRE